jgi:hypothetical protein
VGGSESADTDHRHPIGNCSILSPPMEMLIVGHPVQNQRGILYPS